MALFAGLGFYAWGAPRFLPVVVVLAFVDFELGRMIARLREEPGSMTRARVLLASGIAMHLSVLVYFKFSNFFVRETNILLGWAGVRGFAWTDVALPIGVSFITFEEISYLTDVYRGNTPPARARSDYLLFLLLFPHSIAGPIFRWKDLRGQIAHRDHDWALVRSGFERFALGLAKKVLVADSVGTIVDGIFALTRAQTTASSAWLGGVAFAVQVYFDFSGYSDMAIGLGRMIGFQFKENFDAPYASASLTEFWHRWHISLSTWFRDYLYIPLGGNALGPRRTLVNLMIVFLLSGLWHGAAWTFVCWGAYHGVLIVAERILDRQRRRLPLFIQHMITLGLFVIGLVIFRATSVRQAFDMILAMGGMNRLDRHMPGPVHALIMSHQAVFALVVGIAIALSPIVGKYRLVERIRIPVEGHGVARAGSLLLFLASVIHLTNMKITPLIYFRF